jgi:photosystem II stability/assembly factor-like uncharacterized protein
VVKKLSPLAVVFSSACFFLSPAVHTQNSSRSAGARNANVLLRFELLSRTAAWAIVHQPLNHSDDRPQRCRSSHLYLTRNGGRSWRDITPSSMPTRDIGQIFFLDPSHVWMLSTDALDDQPFYLLSTQDGGKHWRRLVIERPTFHVMDDYYSPTQLYFIDSQHGWMLWQWHLMNSTRDALFATNDGGRTWKRLANPPGGGPMQFVSAHDGWLIGGPEKWRGIARPEDTELWVTHDGGVEWNPVAVPVPVDSPQQRPYLISLKFKNMSEGVIAAGAQEPQGDDQRYTNCFTRDGGKTWRFSQFDAQSAGPSIVDEHIYWCVVRHPVPAFFKARVILQRDTKPISFALPKTIVSNAGSFCAHFIDDRNAWALVRIGVERKLVVTPDGGKTSKFMPLPVKTIE